MPESFLDRFSASEVARIREAGTEVTVPAGWSPIWEGTPSDKAYVLLEGEVSVRHGSDEFAVLTPGDIMGETSIVNQKLRNATLVATSDLRALHLTRETIEQLSSEIPSFREALDDAVARHTPGG